MKRTLIILLLITLAASLYCQTTLYFPGAKEMGLKDYEKAGKKIAKAIADDSTSTLNWYAAYKYYSHAKNNKRNLDSAYLSAQKAQRCYNAVNNLQRALMKRDGLTGEMISDAVRSTVEKAFVEAQSVANKAALSHFLEVYEEGATEWQKQAIIDGLNHLAFIEAEKINTIESYSEFVATHSESKDAALAQQRVYALAYSAVSAVDNIESYKQFIKDYPQAPEADSAQQRIYSIAYYKAVEKNSSEALLAYVAEYPQSPLSPTAERHARMMRFALETNPSDWHSFERYINNHPDEPEQVAVARRIIAEMSIETKNVDGLLYSLNNCEKSLNDSVIMALHNIYVNCDKIAEFDAVYGHLVPDSVRQKDNDALNAIIKAQMTDRKSIVDAINATAPYRIAYDMLLYLIELDAGRKSWNYVNKTLEQFADCFAGNNDYKALRTTSAATLSRRCDTIWMTDIINTANGDEHSPVITLDGRTLFFAAKNRAANIGGDDIFVCHKGLNGKWYQPYPIFGDVNTVISNEVPLAISPDGKTLALSRDDKLIIARLYGDGWRTESMLPQNWEISKWKNDVCFASDGLTVLFVAKKRTEQEVTPSLNIYVTTKMNDSTWSNPISLGPAINTFGVERHPFLHADMKTLYFLSNRHSNIGGIDLFKSTRLSENSWTEWSEPVNVGKNLNSVGDDPAINVAIDGKTAFTSARRGASLDLCSFTLPKSMRASSVAVVEGKVVDRAGRAVATKLVWEDLATSKRMGEYNTNSTTGHFLIVLPIGKHYGIYVADSAYFPVATDVDLASQKELTSIKRDIVVTRFTEMVKDSISAALNNIFFVSSQADIEPISMPEIARLAKLLKSIDGEVCIKYGVGDSESLRIGSLDMQRAQTVKSCLGYYGCGLEKIVLQPNVRMDEIVNTPRSKKKSRLDIVISGLPKL